MNNEEILRIFKSQFMLSKRGLAQKTFDSYMESIKLLTEYLDGKNLLEVTRSDIERYLTHIIIDLGNSKRTYNARLAAFRTFYNMLRKSSQLESLDIKNPSENIEMYLIRDDDKKEKNTLTKEEEGLLLKYSNPRQKAMIALMLTNGLRISEVVNLTVEQYNSIENDAIVLTKTKGSKHRFAIIPKVTQDIINKYLSTRKTQSDLLFTTCHGNMVDVANMRKELKKIAKKAGFSEDRIKDINNHLFRHTCANELLNIENVPIDIVQEVLGHSNIVTTRGYAKTNVSRMQNVMSNRQLANV